MRHQPHLLLGDQWDDDRIPLTADQAHHVGRVLRLGDGATLTYSYGRGLFGEGTLQGTSLIRGKERSMARPYRPLTVAAVPIRDKTRARFLVEKLAEVGVARLMWIESDFGQSSPPTKAQSWADQAFEQSRAVWRMEVVIGDKAQLQGTIVAADGAGGSWPAQPVDTIVVGPEGGWSDADLAADWPRVSLGPTTLRSETAALVAATQCFSLYAAVPHQ